LRGVLTRLKNASNDDGYGSAPSSGSDVSACVEQLEDGDGSTSEVDSSDEAGNVMDLLFGNPFSDTEEDDVSAGVPTLLHWENGTSIDTEPAKKMAETPSTVNPEFQHLFGSPIDAVFAMLPYLFREIMAFEINKYAKQVLDNSDKNKIAGYQRKAVSVGEVITYFGILIFAVLYPQTGRRFQSSWKNPDLHPWTTAMCKYDSLHKVRPLLEIIKKTLGRYGVPGSEFSFDEATMACFSRYGRGLISFNPKKKHREVSL